MKFQHQQISVSESPKPFFFNLSQKNRATVGERQKENRSAIEVQGQAAQTDQQVLMEQIAKLINGDGLNARGYPRVENDKMLLKRQ